MRPPLRGFGGHPRFHQYQSLFRGLYTDSQRPIYDVLGRRVLFDQEPLLDDCAHVCYGGLAGQAYNAAYWNEARAERIAWIEFALTSPTVRIHPDRDGPSKQRYILFVPPDDGTPQVNEFYCVIVGVLSKDTVAFLTAYCISSDTFDSYRNIGPRIYPPPVPKKKRR